MAVVKLPDRLIDSAEIAARATHRSIPEQLEYWITLGRTAEDNPDLPLSFIRDTLEARSQIDAGVGLTEFNFGP